MKDFRAQVYVRLRPSVHDPQGETIRGALATMGYGDVRDVRQGKLFELTLSRDSREEAEAAVREIASKVLSNPVIESYDFTVEADSK